MPRFWNGKNLDTETPELGLRLEAAALIPQFCDQLLRSGLCDKTDELLFTPLDDLKAWLRQQQPSPDPELRELLLAGEEAEAKKAAAEGRRFDVVEYELEMMQEDDSFESFDISWAHHIFKVMVDEADALQAWALRELKSNFSMAMSFKLPEPRKNPVLGLESIEEALRRFGVEAKLLERTLRGRSQNLEFSGNLLLEFFPRGELRAPQGSLETAFVSVAIADARVGDTCDASLSLGYPRALEGYFLLSFDQLRKQLTLKEEA